MPAASTNRGFIADQTARHLVEDLYTYVSDGMNYTLYEQPHREMCNFLESLLPPPPHAMKDAEQKKGMLLAPRETLKTSIGAQGLAEYFLTKWKVEYDYDGRVIIVRAARENAQEVLKAISIDLSDGNAVLQQAFGDLSKDSPMWKNESIILNWRTMVYREPSISTAAPGHSATGKHVDLIIIDDIANETNFESEAKMKEAWRYIQSLDPVLSQWGSMVVIGTRWGHNDPYGKILELNANLEEQGKAPVWKTLIRSVYRDDPGYEGELYYPAFLSERRIEQKRNALEEKMFTAFYLNKVVAESSQVFKPGYLQYYDGDYTPDDGDEIASLQIANCTKVAWNSVKTPVRCTVHIDPASTATKTSNYTAMAIVLTDIDGNMWIHDSWKGREVPSAIRSRIVSFVGQNGPKSLSIDTLGQQVLWVDDIERDLREAGLQCQVLLHKGKALRDGKISAGIRSKASRIESLEPWFREGRIFLRRGHCSAIVNEYNFYDGPTNTNHFDMLDALAQAPVFTRKPDPLRYRDDLEALEEAMEMDDDPPERRRRPGVWAGR